MEEVGEGEEQKRINRRRTGTKIFRPRTRVEEKASEKTGRGHLHRRKMSRKINSNKRKSKGSKKGRAETHQTGVMKRILAGPRR